MTDPFDAPAGDAAVTFQPGQLDVRLALRDGFDAMIRNFWSWLGVLFATYAALLVLQCSLVGLVAVPALWWGFTKHSLEALDGKPAFEVAFSGFKDFGARSLGVLGAFALQILATLPGYLLLGGVLGVAITAQMVVAPDAEVPWLIVVGYAVAIPAMVAALLPLFRITLNVYFVVDQGMGPTDATRAAWAVSRGNVLRLLLLFLSFGALVLIGELMLFVGVIPAMMIQFGALASAYRQLAGLRPRSAE